MSADLWAEFGEPKSSNGENENGLRPQSDVGDQNHADLIPDLANSFEKNEAREETLWSRDEAGVDVLFDSSSNQHNHAEDFGEVKQNVDEVVHSPGLLSQHHQWQNQDDEWGDFSTAVLGEGLTEEKFDSSDGLPNFQLRPESGKPSGAQTQGLETDIKTPQNSINCFQSLPSVPRHCSPNSRPSDEMQGKLVPVAKTAPLIPVNEARPTYVPPPTILLQILPKIFHDLVNRVQSQQPAQTSDIIIKVYRVSGRLIAGRSLRWKRDSILNQSMKIAPAAIGGKGGGMKLASLNKSERLKEEREVIDAVQVWCRHAQFFNSTVNRARPGQAAMRLSEQMRPSVGKGIGVLTSQHFCALCGLKREERVAETDLGVEDSFGEFWTENWGHVDCKEFWCLNRALLSQR